MEKYISKSAVIAEIERRIFEDYNSGDEEMEEVDEAVKGALASLRYFLDTLEVKAADEKYDCPTIQKKEDVASRMEYIDEDLKPIADFILDYAEWNLHKDEWNHPVLEVPLFRVLDALVQRGKPYCEC